jgi:hypothetical protein
MLNPLPVADDIASFVKSLKQPDGTKITDDILKTMWEGIVTRLYNDIKAHAVVNSAGVGTVTSGAGSGGAVITTDIGVIT